MLRTFIAIDFTEAVISKIGKIIEYFKTQTPSDALKWISTENLHLTIKFLGEIREDRLNQVKTILSDVITGQPAFSIGIEGLGMYPNKHHPRVIWLGITNNDTLTDIHAILDRAFTAVGVNPDKREYTPHATIARVNRHINPETVKEIGESLSQFKVDSLGHIKVEEIILYKSELTPNGAIYSPLTSIALNEV